MNGAGWFVAGWISASAFIAIGLLVHYRRQRARERFQTTTQWLQEPDADQRLQQIGRRWYPPVPGTRASES